MSWREVDEYLKHLLEARNHRPRSSAYDRRMRAARRYYVRMNERERGLASRYLRGDLSERELRERVEGKPTSWLQRESARRQLRDPSPRRKSHRRDPSESPVPKAMRVIRLYHEQGRTWEKAARLFMRNHPRMALEVMDRIGSWPATEPELRALQRAW